MNFNISIDDNNKYMFSFTGKGVHHRIPLHSIVYIESSKRKCIIHTLHDHSKTSQNNTSSYEAKQNENEMSFYGKLNEVSELLSEYGFVRCHQSFLVSLQHSDRYYDGFLYTHRNTIPVSERYRSRIISLFDNNKTLLNNAQNSNNIGKSIEGSDNENRNTKGGNDISSTTTISTITGVIVCISGEYKGSIIRIYPDIEYEIGRDGSKCEIIINQPYISRKHCTLSYREDGSYMITDHSHNGTYLIQNNGSPRKLITDKIETLPTGSIISFGDIDLKYRLI